MRAVLGGMYGVVVFVIGLVAAVWFGLRDGWPHRNLPSGERERRAQRAAWRWSGFVVRRLLRVRVTEDAPRPAVPAGGVLIVANHRSWLDPLLIMSEIQSNGLSKGSIGRIPFIGYFGRLTGAVFFDREDAEDRARARQQVRHLLRSGCNLVVFPEGTRTRDGRLRARVSLRLVEDAWADGLLVLPCAVRDTERVLPTAYPGAYPGEACGVWWGRVHDPTTFGSAEAFAAAVWAEVAAHAPR